MGSLPDDKMMVIDDARGWSGSVGGRAVRCITAQGQLDFHLGYDHDEDDCADVLALCRRFDISVPAPYQR